MQECSTQLFTLDSNGTQIQMTETSEICANGVLTLNNGNIFLYGSKYQAVGNYIITKAAYTLYDPAMKIVKEDMMGMIDGPDAYLPGLYISMFPTSSDFLTAIQLSDGRIACGGRVYMPRETTPVAIQTSERYNRAFLVLMDDNGNFRSK
jgi:hypothetical protein